MEEILSFKLVLIGESGVGKSSLFYRYIQSNNSKFETMPSEQPQFATKTMPFKDYNKSIKFDIWDTAGQERYRALAKVFYQNCDGCLLIYDICDRKSFDELILVILTCGKLLTFSSIAGSEKSGLGLVSTFASSCIHLRFDYQNIRHLMDLYFYHLYHNSRLLKLHNLLLNK